MTESGLDHKAKGAEAETPRRGRGCALGGGGLVLWGRGCALLTVFLGPGDAKLGPSSAQGPPWRRYLKGERVCFLSLKAKGSCRLAGQPVVKGTCEKKRSVENGAWLRTGNGGGRGRGSPSSPASASASRARGGLLHAPGSPEAPLAPPLWDLSNWPWRRVAEEQSSGAPQAQPRG